MSPDSDAPTAAGPIEVLAFSGANSGAYLSAVFGAYREGRVVLALPRTPDIKNLPGTKVVDRRSFDDAPGWFDERFDPIHSDAAAQVSFSSGTTGRPKALLLSHRALTDVVERINRAMQVDDTISEYVGVPVTFSFGFGRCRAVAAAGGRSFLPALGFDPTEIVRMLRAGEINAISAVPTLWRVLLGNPEQVGDAGARVRWIEIGSQYMAGDEKLALRRLFPNAKIVQHYGLTEASRSTLLDISTADASRLESVGRATGNVELAISDAGHIRIRGPHLADGVVSGAGVKPITDADGWLTTSDLGRLDDGWLYYGGRADDLINCGGVKIDPVQFEQQLTQALGCSGDIAVGRAADPLRGEQVLVAARRAAGLDRGAIEQAALNIAKGYGLTGRGAFTFREVEAFPTTATGKLQRAQLSQMPDVGATPPVLAAPTQATSIAAAAAGEVDRLRALWAEILGVPSVSLHESFYEMGGDSLSALAAIIRMETLGIDRNVARGILEGKSIAQMVGVSGLKPATSVSAAAAAPARLSAAPPTVPAAPPAGDSARVAELQRVWAEVLGVPSVSLHESFYDLGGDSLSALGAIMRMESVGIDRAVARGILEGKSIAQMVGAADGEPAPQPPAPSAPSVADVSIADEPAPLTLANAVNAVHAIRGVLILWVVVVHWLHGLLLRVAEESTWIMQTLAPAFRYGTPGFAMVFGIGVGALAIPHYRRNRELFRKSTRFNTKLIVSGVLLFALFKFFVLWGDGDLRNPNIESLLFYSAISYYALAMLTLPLIVRVLMIGSNTLMTILITGLACMVIHEVLHASIAALRPDGWLELGKILLTAKYGYFRMTSFVMVGAAIGYVVRAHFASPGLPKALALAGLTVAGFGALTLYEARPDNLLENFGQGQPWHLMIFTGVTLVLMALFCVINRGGGEGKPRVVQWVNAFLIASGILALPIFVGHEIVRPAKDIMVNLGMPEGASLVIAVTAFFAAMSLVYVRLMRFLIR